jgi:hypothetical protein
MLRFVVHAILAKVGPAVLLISYLQQRASLRSPVPIRLEVRYGPTGARAMRFSHTAVCM